MDHRENDAPTILLFLLVSFAQEHIYRAVPSNDTEDTHTDTQTDERDLARTPAI
jgi:hypothetical protein